VNWQAALESLSNAAASRLWPSADLEMGFSVSECSFSYHSRSLPLLVPPLSCRTSVELDARSAAHIGGREGRVLPQLVVGRGLHRRLGKVRKKINSSAGLEQLVSSPGKALKLVSSPSRSLKHSCQSLPRPHQSFTNSSNGPAASTTR
jgi:hypothetical protein